MIFFSFFLLFCIRIYTLCLYIGAERHGYFLYAVRIGFEWDSLLCCVVNGKKKKKAFGADEKKNYTQLATKVHHQRNHS